MKKNFRRGKICGWLRFLAGYIMASVVLTAGVWIIWPAGIQGYIKAQEDQGNMEAETGEEKEGFYSMEIHEGDEIFERINGRSYRENDDISLDELRYLKIRHYDFDHEIQEGEMIVNKEITQDCLDIFWQLFEAEYEIESVRLIDEYWTGDGDTTDTASIEENNTSAFCYRTVTGGQSLSNHALGLAIDINPRQNPYFSYSTGEQVWYHEGDENYLDRDAGMEHVITEEDLCYKLFMEYGFTWGGSWSNPKDYQHFEKEEQD